ncbi:serine/threonine-protein kinase [Kitasatospora sp. NPDC001539]|uniref:serine/threonine-protein kinase n=1 Tax=Kitasatospora sp. NPDC001539 TaxID=3154384 RepID=UPI00332794BC
MGGDAGGLLAGRYRLVEVLGRGGMGVVWRAHDARLDREVAVKELLLPGHLTGPERESWIARLDREARAAARLKHPGIVTVHDWVMSEDGQPWIVMELVRGGSLAALLASQGRLPVWQVARIGLQVLDALQAAHRAGITHRDIKPANILLEHDRAVLTDFGIAALDGDTALTATGAIMGTPAFMAPEQVRGLPATSASDLWALGATLYAAVQGNSPFNGTHPAAVLVAVATEDPLPATHAGPLGPVLADLLQKDPARRLTHDHLRTLLTGLASAVPSTTRPDGQPFAAAPPADAPAPATAPRRRPRRTALITAAVLVLVAAVSLGGYLLYSHGGAEEESAAYRANLTLSQRFGQPDGFSRQPNTRLDGDRIRLTYAAPATCDPCHPQTRAAIDWLKQQPGIAAVQPPVRGYDLQNCHQAGDCSLAIMSSGTPPVSNGQWYVTDGRLLFQIDIG